MQTQTNMIKKIESIGGGLDTESYERCALQAELNSVFRPAYQAIINVGSGDICGAEALYRSHNPQFSQITTERLIAIAEREGVIPEFDGKMLDRCMVDLPSFCQRHFADDFFLSINMSSTTLSDFNHVQTICDRISNCDIEAQHVCIELTETQKITDFAILEDSLSALIDIGARVALDDFGNGYSTLAYLSCLPSTLVKLDKHFVQKVSTPKDAMIVSHMIQMCADLGLQVVAEGIETRDQYHALVEVAEGLIPQKDFMVQGYLFSKPCPKDEIFEAYA